MKVLGIGNAIVDVICKVEESFLSENNLTKSTMKLVDETEFKKLLSNLKIEETIAGGSVANSIVGLSQLGNPVSFIGKVNNDELGNKYEKSLTKEKVKYCYQKKKETIPTGTCLVLITPDSERTMCTFLGIAGKISEKDIDENAVKNSELIFLEGYLWDEGEPRTAFNKAINISKTTGAHAISYGISIYAGVSHGHAVALTLGKFFILNQLLLTKKKFEKDVATNQNYTLQNP